MRELSNEYLVAKIGFDTAENEPLKVWRGYGAGMLHALGSRAQLRGLASGPVGNRALVRHRRLLGGAVDSEEARHA